MFQNVCILLYVNQFLFHFASAVVAMFSSKHHAEIVDRLQALSEDTSRQCGLWSVVDCRRKGLMLPDSTCGGWSDSVPDLSEGNGARTVNGKVDRILVVG